MSAREPVTLDETEPARAWQRFVAVFLDSLAVGGAALLLVLVVGAPFVEAVVFLSAPYSVTLHLIADGQTPGKRYAGIRLVTDAGEPVSALRAALRWLVAVGSTVALGVGHLWMLFEPNRRTWHDLAARTIVIRWRPPTLTANGDNRSLS